MGLLSTIGAASGRAFGFTRSAIAAATDAFFNRVTLLLPGNGTNGAQNNTFLDSSSNNFTITRNGNTTQGTFSPFSQTGWGNYFDGTDDGLTVANNAGFATLKDSAWTVECWAYANSTSSSACIIGCSTYSTGAGFQIFILSNSIALYANGSGGSNITGSTFPLNQWNHVAAVRNSSGQVALFLNGARQGASNPYTINLENVTTNPLVIGAVTSSNGWNSSLAFNGYISNARVVKGTAVYDPTQSTITVPTSPLTPITNTVLLTCQSNSFIDTNTQVSAKTITVAAGTPSVQAFSPFAPTAAYSAATNGGSGYFDGSGDYLVMATASAAINPSTSTTPFTIECWVYNTGTSSTVLFSALGSENYGFVLGFGSAVGTYDSTQTPWFANYTGSWNGIRSTTAIPRNAWTHLACVFTGSTSYIYQDGVMRASGGPTTWGVTGSSKVRIGCRVDATTDTFTGYISGARVVIGSNLYPSGTTFTPPTAPPTAVTNTQLLTNFTNAGITDATAKNVLETVGNAQISTTQSKFGGSSMYFDGTGDWAIVPANAMFNLGTSDFTIEGWFYLTTTASAQYFLGTFAVSPNRGWFAYFDTTLKLAFTYSTTGSNAVDAGFGYTPSTNTWVHFAFVRSGADLKFYANGTQQGSTHNIGTSSIYANTQPLYIGERGSATGAAFNGYIDDLRITRYARYTANFTAPTAAFPLQ